MRVAPFVKFIVPMKHHLANVFKLPWYFAFFAVYPSLALIAYNIDELRPAEGLRSLVFSELVALVLFSLFWLVFRSKQRAALAVSILLLLFFSYGHIYEDKAALGISRERKEAKNEQDCCVA